MTPTNKALEAARTADKTAEDELIERCKKICARMKPEDERDIGALIDLLMDVGDMHKARATAAEQRIAAMRTYLNIFLGGDDRFQIAVGGNPIAVDKMLAEARAAAEREAGALSREEGAAG